MKFLILVCAVLATALAAPNVDQEAAKASARKVKEAHEACNADPATRIDVEAVKKARSEGKHEKPANAAAHALCLSKKLGWQKDDGSVNVEVIRSRAAAIYGDTTKLEEFITECTQAPGTPEEVAEHLVDCYMKHSPRGTLPRDHH